MDEKAAASLAAVRELSEGRGPKRWLHCVPLKEYTAPRARVEEVTVGHAEACTPSEPPARGRGYSGLPVAEAMDLFRQYNGCCRVFSAKECACFMCAAGWSAAMPEALAAQKLRKLYWAGQVEEAGRDGKCILWKFTAPVTDTGTRLRSEATAGRHTLSAGEGHQDTYITPACEHPGANPQLSTLNHEPTAEVQYGAARNGGHAEAWTPNGESRLNHNEPTTRPPGLEDHGRPVLLNWTNGKDGKV